MNLSEKRRAQLLAGPYTRLLASHEDAVADLYATLAVTLRNANAFWSSMAKEELDHKKLILTIDNKLQRAEYVFKRPVFVTTTIDSSLQWLAARQEAIKRDGISMREALKLALSVESTMIEAGFFQVLDADTPGMMDILKSLEAYTKAHIRQLELEARRFKWRLTGWRRSHPKAVTDRAVGKSVQASVKAAQADMLGLLVSLEESTACLYSAYSRRLKASERFWTELAAEEMQHAALMRSLYRILDSGSVFYNVGRFNREAIQTDVHAVLNAEYAARHEKLSPMDAINTALRIERFITETGFFSTVRSDSREYQIIAERLAHCTKEHVKRLEQEAGYAIDMGDAARKDVPLAD